MRYAQIREMDVSNGEGVGVSLFVQGCHFRCPGCFNQETWDFNGGKEWTDEVCEKFFQLIDKPYIKRVSFLGGEPLADENVADVASLIFAIKYGFPDKKIWIYTGYNFEDIFEFNPTGKIKDTSRAEWFRYDALLSADILVDGPFRIDLQDVNHKQIKFAGSTNQRIIDLPKTIEQKKIITIQN